MVHFTDSPYERMMMQKPEPGRVGAQPPALPTGHRCFGCPYGQNKPCVGVCMAEVLDSRKGKA